MKQEGGYMTAFSIIISLILISVTIYNIKILESERQFHVKRLIWFKADVTLELARDEVFNDLLSGNIQADDQGSLSFDYGIVDYNVTLMPDDIYAVRFDLRLHNSGRKTGLLYYNYVNREVVQWKVV
ncbi:competence type IV pilus minor pilin ComGG [Bacillus sp. Marseille-Q3570]|uniref:competence type IV pilus minor pilin ComGG n=1 Tax=Bacillus sp. Marseille-Q3570 TaxID=2963522 RepID=UPI0021B7ACB8|nr:competence type IV pilus minor pilin ComGG [Bacillus sp. Marseille-Q3570]